MMEVILVTAIIFVSVLHFMNSLVEALIASAVALFLGSVIAQADGLPPVPAPTEAVKELSPAEAVRLYPLCRGALSACDEAVQKLKDEVQVRKDSERQLKKAIAGPPPEPPIVLIATIAGALGGAAGGAVVDSQKGVAAGGAVGAIVGVVMGLIFGGGK